MSHTRGLTHLRSTPHIYLQPPEQAGTLTYTNFWFLEPPTNNDRPALALPATSLEMHAMCLSRRVAKSALLMGSKCSPRQDTSNQLQLARCTHFKSLGADFPFLSRPCITSPREQSFTFWRHRPYEMNHFLIPCLLNFQELSVAHHSQYSCCSSD